MLNALRAVEACGRPAAAAASARFEVVAVNATTTLYTAGFSAGGWSEIVDSVATSLITAGSNGRRICALAVHSR